MNKRIVTINGENFILLKMARKFAFSNIKMECRKLSIPFCNQQNNKSNNNRDNQSYKRRNKRRNQAKEIH